ncbi:MAG TPA: hypothetical protein VK166_07470 [Chitinophagaceae bacterium]|nr:hypothetical protein [Chitinophagaceae bacterium]
MLTVLVLNLIPGMSDVAAIMLGMLVFGLILRGGWWLLNQSARHPRPLLAPKAAGTASAAVSRLSKKVGLPVIFRMSTTTQVILYVLLLSPPVAVTIMMRDEWEGIVNFLMGIVLSLLHPSSLFVFCMIYLLCPYTAWNIYWRRKDFISFDDHQIEYRSGFTSGKLVPGKITLFRGRSWRFDLTDLFRGQMASSWFLDMVPIPGTGEKSATGEEEHVILDLKAMNLGGSAKSIAKVSSQLYGDKFLINNQLP